MQTRAGKPMDERKAIGMKNAPDDERAFRIFLISSFASLVVLALLAVLGTG